MQTSWPVKYCMGVLSNVDICVINSKGLWVIVADEMNGWDKGLIDIFMSNRFCMVMDEMDPVECIIFEEAWSHGIGML